MNDSLGEGVYLFKKKGKLVKRYRKETLDRIYWYPEGLDESLELLGKVITSISKEFIHNEKIKVNQV